MILIKKWMNQFLMEWKFWQVKIWFQNRRYKTKRRQIQQQQQQHEVAAATLAFNNMAAALGHHSPARRVAIRILHSRDDPAAGGPLTEDAALPFHRSINGLPFHLPPYYYCPPYLPCAPVAPSSSSGALNQWTQNL